MSTHFRGLRESLSRNWAGSYGVITKARWPENQEALSSGEGALQELSEIVGGEIEAGGFHVVAFATDLYHADDAIAAENRRADDFLDDFRGFGGEFNAPENAGVPKGGEIIDDFGAAFEGSARGERGFARERDEADILEHFWNDEVLMPPATGDVEDGHFIGANRKGFDDAFREETNEICG